MKFRVVIVGLVSLIGSGLNAQDKPAAQKGDPRAADLMEQAAKSRYTWSQDFAAVSGKFTWNIDGKSGAGTFHYKLRQKGGPTFTADGGTEIPADVKEHIASMIFHRVPPAAGAARRPQPSYVIVIEDEDRGPLIMTVGDKMHSTQRIKDGRMVQVNRLMEGKRFTIDVREFEKSPDGRCYPATFTVTYWDADSGKMVENQVHTTEGIELISGQMFPKAEKVVTRKEGSSTLQIQYSDIKFEMAGPGGDAK
jgi:hypothetical protein